MIRLNDLISSANVRQAKLITPIYSPERKVSSQAIDLATELLLGLLMGFLYILYKKIRLTSKVTVV
jgi:hypothetical protein